MGDENLWKVGALAQNFFDQIHEAKQNRLFG